MSVRRGRSPQRTGRDCRQGPSSPSPVSVSDFSLFPPPPPELDSGMAWPGPDLLGKGGSTLLAGEGSYRTQTALIKCPNGQTWAVPRWTTVDIIPALWGFQDDPATQLGTDTDEQPEMRIKQDVKSDSVCVHRHVR